MRKRLYEHIDYKPKGGTLQGPSSVAKGASQQLRVGVMATEANTRAASCGNQANEEDEPRTQAADEHFVGHVENHMDSARPLQNITGLQRCAIKNNGVHLASTLT